MVLFLLIIIALELAAILIGVLYACSALPEEPVKDTSAFHAPVVFPQFVPHEEGLVSIVKRVDDNWVHVGRRHASHPDITEALRTEGLALQHPDGTIQEN